MTTFRATSILVATYLLLTLPASAKPNRIALDHARSLAASRMGVDKADYLWAWNAIEGEVTLISPAGDRRSLDIGFDVIAIDVDAQRGVVTLGSGGSSVTVSAPDGTITRFKLPSGANGISWLDGDKIAVTPETAGSLAEIWSISRKIRLQQVGPTSPVEVPERGAVLNRAILLHYSDQRHELTLFDAFYGKISVFDTSGKPLRTAQITHQRLEANLAWLRDLDASSKAQGTSSTPTMYNYARMSVSSDGVIWLGEDGTTPESITVAKVLPSGVIQRKSVTVPECTSVRYELWQNQLVFFREPRSPRKQCTAIKEVPR